MQDNIWDQTAGDDSDETYGDQAVTSSLESVEKMYILKEKAADYNVELTDDDEARSQMQHHSLWLQTVKRQLRNLR